MDSDHLNSLIVSIQLNPNYYDRAKNDSMYDANIKLQVNSLLNKMYQQVKTNAEKEIHSLEFAAEKMKKWFEKGYASDNDIQKYKSIINDISNAKKLIITQSYVGYVNTIKLTSGTKQIVDGIQDSIRNNLRTCQNQVESYSNRIIELPNRMNKIRANKIGDFVKYLVYSIACIIFFSIYYNGLVSGWSIPAFIVSMGEFNGFFMFGLWNVLWAISMFGLPASIWYFFKAINNFLEISTSEEINKLRKEKKELNEQVIALNKKITIANISLF
ncbi:MAG: hypothetical protein KKA10_17290 [Euryarchaeota archaeon]|nr:hypothetical protein [Euryarchaeota archaeon]MCG2738165.1 hypothetical protein [Candidatus Methanoperedenaceae archaeon]